MAIDAPARHRQRAVAVCTGHCAVGELVAEVARGPASNVGEVGVERWIRQVELVREGSRLKMRWWGHVLVGRIGEVCGKAGGRKRSHGWQWVREILVEV